MNPTPQERAAVVCQSIRKGHDPANCLVCAAIANAIREAERRGAMREREAFRKVCEDAQAYGAMGLWEEVNKRPLP